MSQPEIIAAIVAAVCSLVAIVCTLWWLFIELPQRQAEDREYARYEARHERLSHTADIPAVEYDPTAAELQQLRDAETIAYMQAIKADIAAADKAPALIEGPWQESGPPSDEQIAALLDSGYLASVPWLARR